jgi:hypothetical protein
MPKKKNIRHESEKKTEMADSDNYIENDKYVKKLKLQRTVLNKLIGTDISLAPFIEPTNDEDSDSK